MQNPKPDVSNNAFYTVTKRSIKESDVTAVKIVNKFDMIKTNFNNMVDNESKKYPLTSREQMFVQVINEILDTCSTSVRY